MRRALIAASLGLAACSASEPGRIGDPAVRYLVASDTQHVVLLTATTARSIDLGTLREVWRQDGLYRQAVDSVGGALSADGTRYVSWTADERLLSIPLAGGTPVELGQGHGNPYLPAFSISPDSRFVAYSYLNELRVVPLTGGPPVLRVSIAPDPIYLFAGDTFIYRAADYTLQARSLTQADAPIIHFGTVGVYTLSPDRTRLAYFDQLGMNIVPVTGGSSSLVLDTSYADVDGEFRAFFSPDWEHLVAQSGAALLPEKRVSVLPLGGGPVVNFPGLQISVLVAPSNWPAARGYLDSQRVLLVDDNQFLWVGSTSGELLPLGVPPGNLGLLSPDGAWLTAGLPFGVSGCPNCSSVALLSTTGKTSWRIGGDDNPTPIWGFDFSPDASSLLIVGAVHRTNDVSTDSGGDLSVSSVEGGPLRLIERDVDLASWLDANRILFIRRNDGAGPAGTYVREVQ